MTVRVIDTACAAVSADAQLASPVLQWAADTGLAAQTDATRGAAAAWDFRYPPQLHSVPSGNDDEVAPAAELGWMILLWRPAARATSVTLRARITTAVGPCRLGVHFHRLDDLIRGGGIGAPVQTYDTSVGEETAVIAATGLSLEPGALYAVVLSCASSLDTDAVQGLYDRNHGSDATSLTGWVAPAIYADRHTGHDHYWSEDGVSFSALVEDVRPYCVEIVSGSDPFAADYATASAKSGGPIPRGRLLWRVGRAVSNLINGDTVDALWVWPPVEDRLATVSLGSGDWIRRTPLGYVQLHSVELVEGVTALPGYGTLLAPERPATSQAGQVPALYAEHALGQHARTYAIAPACDYRATQADGVAGGYDHQLGVRANMEGAYTPNVFGGLDFTGTYTTLAETVVGDPDQWETDGATYARAVYRVSTLLSLIAQGSGATQAIDLELRATITDLDGSSNPSTAVVLSVPAAPLVRYTQRHIQLTGADAHWQCFQGSSSNRTPQRHSLRGAWCNAAWRVASPVVAELVIPDDVDPAGRQRVLILEARPATGPGFGNDTEAFFLIDGLHVEALRGFGAAAAVEVP